MERIIMNTLIVNDDDLDCDCKETTLDNMTIANVGFRLPDIEKFDIVQMSLRSDLKEEIFIILHLILL